MVTHLGGNPVDLDRLYALADRHGLAVIEDAAHACGSTYHGVRIGGGGGMQAFSFQATKNLTTIDGGMICLRNEADAARARRLRWMGIDHDTWSRSRTNVYRWSYDVAELGHKYAMNDLQAAIGLAHLPLLEAGNDRRRRIASRYRAELADVDGLQLVEPPPGCSSATYICPLLADRRDHLIDQLADSGIGSGVHYRRNDDHAIFGPPRDLPGAEAYWSRTLSIPVHLGLTDGDVDQVVQAVRKDA
jgi:perosamine synthetase